MFQSVSSKKTSTGDWNQNIVAIVARQFRHSNTPLRTIAVSSRPADGLFGSFEHRGIGEDLHIKIDVKFRL